MANKPEATKPTAPAAAAAPPAPPVAAKPEATKPAAPPPRFVALNVSRWSEAQFKQSRHAVSPEANTPYLHLFDPAYFAHIAPKVNANDVIEVRPAEGSYYAELYIWSKGPNWLQVSELRKIDRPSSGVLPSVDKNFSVEFVEGPSAHRVIRNSDRGVVAQGFDSPETANTWLANNIKRIAA
jgi:hypothetical protein